MVLELQALIKYFIGPMQKYGVKIIVWSASVKEPVGVRYGGPIIQFVICTTKQDYLHLLSEQTIRKELQSKINFLKVILWT
jgi:hypothetical protein